MSKKSTSNDLMAALRQQRQESLSDVPPVLAAMEAAAASPPSVKPQPTPAKPARAAKPAEADREKTSVYLTGDAAVAMRKLQAFLMIECGAGTTGVAAVVNVALMLAAEGLPGNRAKLVELLGETRQFDKRRRAAE